MSLWHRIISWSLLMSVLALGGGYALLELSRWQGQVRNAAEETELQASIARRWVQKLPALEAEIAADTNPKPADPFWHGGSVNAALLDMQESVTIQAQNMDLTVLRVEPVARENTLSVRLTLQGRLQELQQVLFDLERQSPRVAVTALTLKPRPEPQLLDITVELIGLHAP